jgi:hypothetical protein
MQQKDTLQGLSQKWRDEAATLRRYGADVSASALVACAEDLEEALRQEDETLLDLQQAAAEMREGKLPNAGRPGAPRIARQHLPRKATEVAGVTPIRQNTNRQVVRSIIDKGVA